MAAPTLNYVSAGTSDVVLPETQYTPTITFPESEAERALRRCVSHVHHMRSLSNNWDLAGAVAPCAAVIEAALELLESFLVRQNPPTNAAATPDGGIVIEWDTPESFIEAEIDDPEMIHWMIERPGGQIEHYDQPRGRAGQSVTSEWVAASEAAGPGASSF